MSVNNLFFRGLEQAGQRGTMPAPPQSKVDTKTDSQTDTSRGSKTSGDSPPSYSAETPDITAAFSNLRLDEKADKPTVDECLAHLKLLEAFSQLREDIGTADGLYGIQDDFASALDVEPRTEALAKMREKRWAVFVTRAVDRFEVYWKSCIQPDAPMLRQVPDLNAPSFEDDLASKVVLQFNADNLPPLGMWKKCLMLLVLTVADILLVWHSYMLNPRSFLADCLRAGKMKFWGTGLPWKAINATIDNGTFEYNPSEEARQRFESQTGRAWNNLNDPPIVKLSCPRCRREVTAFWTTSDVQAVWTMDKPGETGTGFADPDFEARCTHCPLVLNHDILRAQKFRNDMQILLLEGCPMPGTFLTLQGTGDTPHFYAGVMLTVVLGLPVPGKTSVTAQLLSFPNRLITSGLTTKLLEYTDMKHQTVASIMGIRTIIEDGIKDPATLEKIAGSDRFRKPSQHERIAIRRMMSSYWNNSSPFALDLVGAVVRQSSFIEKMHKIDWIHSPAVTSTMNRLITKYERYFYILSRYPKQVAVPTLDVDLAWRKCNKRKGSRLLLTIG